MADGYEGIITPMNTKQFEAIVDDVCAHFNGNATGLLVVGAKLRRLLPKAKNVRGRRGMGGIDLHMAAWQVARQLSQAAAAQESSAAAVHRAHQIYFGTFHNPNGPDAVSQFDAG